MLDFVMTYWLMALFVIGGYIVVGWISTAIIAAWLSRREFKFQVEDAVAASKIELGDRWDYSMRRRIEAELEDNTKFSTAEKWAMATLWPLTWAQVGMQALRLSVRAFPQAIRSINRAFTRINETLSRIR
jgi:hypothetical protein